MSDEVFLTRSDVDQTQANAGNNNFPANIVIPTAVQQALNNQNQYK